MATDEKQATIVHFPVLVGACLWYEATVDLHPSPSWQTYLRRIFSTKPSIVWGPKEISASNMPARRTSTFREPSEPFTRR